VTGRCVCASGQEGFSVRSIKEGQVILTGPCLRPVMDHRTRPVPIPEDLDLSGIDRTLGGSVRSLPPERPVSGSRATLSLFGFLFCRVWGIIYPNLFFFLDLSPSRRRALAQATKPHRRCLAKPLHGCAAASSRLTSHPRLHAPAQPRRRSLPVPAAEPRAPA